ncbi:MAG: GtrA family protein [Hyphomicrobiales bacterium]
MSKTAASSFLRFCAVGVFGFLVDAGLLITLITFGASPILARAISVIIAITATWAANRMWTFRSTDENLGLEWLRYLATSAAGAAVNFAIYCTILFSFPLTSPILALAIGSGIALVVNYLGARFFAFSSSYTR